MTFSGTRRSNPVREEVRALSESAIEMATRWRQQGNRQEAVVAVMRQAGALVDVESSEALSDLQVRVRGYTLAALLMMNDDATSFQMANRLLRAIDPLNS
jgi:hypothetical protein